ncbi:MAG: SpoIID/LytB domain-containing protein [Acidobacteriota bacterium]|nr:SpoIID/LytB domain-containing protein [Acidobacteriota bacterium]
MKRLGCWLMAVLLAGCAPAVAQGLRVRLWSQHPPAAAQLTAAPTLELRRCAGCAVTTGGEFRAVARGNTVEAGTLRGARLLVRGRYTLTVEGHAVPLAGELEITAREGALQLTVELPLEEYVAAVLASEAGTMRSAEALKAMAVVARTYAVHFRGRHAAGGYDLCDSTHCQVMRPSLVAEKFREAAQATQGELLWHRGTTAAAYYHKDCGGTAERSGEELLGPGAAVEYLTQHGDPFCQRHGGFTWQSTLRKADVAGALRAAGIRAPKTVNAIAVIERTGSGRVRRLQVRGEFTAVVDEESFHRAMGMSLGWSSVRSALYEIQDQGERVVLHGRGEGHGVGLCQNGAEQMGEEGHGYTEILAFYYPHTRLGVTAQGLPWSRMKGERFDLMTTDPERDSRAMRLGETALREAEEHSGVRLEERVTLRIYPTVAAFRDATGEPGWVAASTSGNTIRLQPLETLQRTRTLNVVLRHEFLHLLVDSRARTGAPRWLREGLVLWLSGERAEGEERMSAAAIERALTAPRSQPELRAAYAAANARVARLAGRYGKAAVMSWLSMGVPVGVDAN